MTKPKVPTRQNRKNSPRSCRSRISIDATGSPRQASALALDSRPAPPALGLQRGGGLRLPRRQLGILVALLEIGQRGQQRLPSAVVDAAFLAALQRLRRADRATVVRLVADPNLHSGPTGWPPRSFRCRNRSNRARLTGRRQRSGALRSWRLSMKQIKNVMSRDVDLVNPSDSIKHAAQLMARDDFGALPVGENDRLVGMITDRDIPVRAVAEGR